MAASWTFSLKDINERNKNDDMTMRYTPEMIWRGFSWKIGYFYDESRFFSSSNSMVFHVIFRPLSSISSQDLQDFGSTSSNAVSPIVCNYQITLRLVPESRAVGALCKTWKNTTQKAFGKRSNVPSSFCGDINFNREQDSIKKYSKLEITLTESPNGREWTKEEIAHSKQWHESFKSNARLKQLISESRSESSDINDSLSSTSVRHHPELMSSIDTSTESGQGFIFKGLSTARKRVDCVPTMNESERSPTRKQEVSGAKKKVISIVGSMRNKMEGMYGTLTMYPSSEDDGGFEKRVHDTVAVTCTGTKIKQKLHPEVTDKSSSASSTLIRGEKEPATAQNPVTSGWSRSGHRRKVKVGVAYETVSDTEMETTKFGDIDRNSRQYSSAKAAVMRKKGTLGRYQCQETKETTQRSSLMRKVKPSAYDLCNTFLEYQKRIQVEQRNHIEDLNKAQQKQMSMENVLESSIRQGRVNVEMMMKHRVESEKRVGAPPSAEDGISKEEQYRRRSGISCSPLCTLCTDRLAKQILLPCRHCSVCTTCGPLLSSCPRCYSHIDSTINLKSFYV